MSEKYIAHILLCIISINICSPNDIKMFLWTFASKWYRGMWALLYCFLLKLKCVQKQFLVSPALLNEGDKQRFAKWGWILWYVFVSFFMSPTTHMDNWTHCYLLCSLCVVDVRIKWFLCRKGEPIIHSTSFYVQQCTCDTKEKDIIEDDNDDDDKIKPNQGPKDLLCGQYTNCDATLPHNFINFY